MGRDPLAGLKVVFETDEPVESPTSAEPIPSSVTTPVSKKDKGKWREKSGGEKRSSLPPSEAALPAPLPARRVPVFEVVTDCAVSWGGQFVRLKAGTRVSAERFGSNAEERLRAAGVTLREVLE